MVSTQDHIEQRISRMPPGKIFFPQDFRTIGTESAIKMALSRIAKDGIAIRVAHGIYATPKTDPLLGDVPPALEDIAQAIARRDRVKIRPTGSYALHKLGLSTQVPLKLVYVTDGAPRNISIGNRGIRFKSTTPKKLATKGKLSGLAIQALETLGRHNTTPDIIARIRSILRKEDPKALRADAMLAPTWIADILFDALTPHENDRMA